jgi:polyferredoxin
MSEPSKKPKKITKDQSRDTGMAMVLLCLLIFLGRHKNGWLYAAMGLHVINMITPIVFKPVAVVWLGLSEFLGNISSKILLSIVFFGVVTPIGVVRRLMGKDSLKLRAFKKSQESAMWDRNHKFTGSDIEQPY